MKRPLIPPSWNDLIGKLDPARIQHVLETTRAAGEQPYRHYDELRHRSPPGDLSVDEWWLGTHLLRGRSIPVPLLDRYGRGFSYTIPDRMQALLHRIDSDTRGQLAAADSAVATPEGRDRFVLSSLIEEAITSSQLEGASTTRRVAAEMLRSGRRPHNRSEQMILNNFRAMQYARDLRETVLTPEVVLDLHRVVCDATLDDPDAAGRLQRPNDDRVAVFDNRDGALLHEPPEAASLPNRLAQMCAFANGDLDEGRFIHPVIRSITLHFWLAYDHPFADGNGRTARALFYWSMLRAGYWLCEFISISRLLRKAPSTYARAFLYTETDANDLTYFLLHQLEVIDRAIDALQDYLRRKTHQLRDIDRRLRLDAAFNHRQRALLAHALRHPGMRYTIESHRRSHQVAYATARADLLGLAAAGLLDEGKEGRRMVFTVPADLERRLRGTNE